MAVISRKHRLLFILNPRTASTAVAQAIMDQLEGEMIPDQDVFSENGKLLVDRKHGTYNQLLKNGVLEQTEAEPLFKFTAVRNPFDSLASNYAKMSGELQSHLEDSESWIHRLPDKVEIIRFCGNHTFDEWVAWRYHSTPVHRLLGKRPKSRYARFTRGMDYVMKKETLDEDFAEALRRAGVQKHVDIPVINQTASRDKDYRQYYSPRSRKLVEYAFREDLRRFGYSY